MEVSEAILKLNQEISSDLFGEAQSWSRSESQVSQRNVGFYYVTYFRFFNIPLLVCSIQVQNRYSETDDNRDWHSRAPIPSPSTVSKVKGRPT